MDRSTCVLISQNHALDLGLNVPMLTAAMFARHKNRVGGDNFKGDVRVAFNGKGQEMVNLGVTVEGSGTLITFNGKGQEMVQLGVLRGGSGGVATFSNGRETGRLP